MTRNGGDKSLAASFSARFGPLALATLMLFGSLALACGGAEPEPEARAEGEGLTGTQVSEMRKQIGDIEFQLEGLEQQASAMRGELEARIDLIDATRAVLATQVDKLKTELGPEKPKAKTRGNVIDTGASALPDTKPPAAAKKKVAETKADAPVVAAGEAAEEEGEDGGGGGFFKFIALIIFLGAIFFLSRFFFDRWGVDEDGDLEPQTERVTELGKIRYPAAAEQPDVFDGNAGGPEVADAEEDAGQELDSEDDPAGDTGEDEAPGGEAGSGGGFGDAPDDETDDEGNDGADDGPGNRPRFDFD